MKWNEYAEIGAKLQTAFKEHEYSKENRLEDASFVFDILDKVRMEDGRTCSFMRPGLVMEID